MAAPMLSAALYGVRAGRAFGTAAALCKRAAPLGPMPNEDIDVSNLEALEKYHSFTRYFKVAEKESKKTPWWKTYKKHITPEQGDVVTAKAVTRFIQELAKFMEDEEAKIDISLPYYRPLRAKQLKERKEILKQNRQNVEMERACRLRTLLIPLDEVRAEWEKTNGLYHKQRVAEHYGIYRHMFNRATFVPRVVLQVEYSLDDEHVMPVYHGNFVTPTEASRPPEVMYEADEGSLWTLLLTNLDGHLQDTDSEYVHWLVTNIPGNNINSGEEICHYFPPFPAKGTGYHRFVFLLFKQDRPIDFTEEVRPNPCHSLKMRTFKTFDFYEKHQNDMTPAGLAFYQCQWDDSVTDIFHKRLNMKEPVFDFVRPPVYHPRQKKFPHLKPLRYLDMYRDSDEPTYGIY